MACLCEELAGRDAAVSPTCIGHLWLFENLKPEELGALVEAAIKKRFEKGQSIFTQGDRAREMFLVKAGRVMLKKLTRDGHEITLDIRKAGDFLGENVISEEEELDYPLSAVCLEDTLTCGFTRESFESLVLAHSNIGLQVIKNMTRRISWLTTQVGSMSMTNLEERLYRVLVNVAREHGVREQKGLRIQFPLTHEDLGFLVGAHRVSITRAMKGLRSSGRLIQEGKSLTLPRDEL